MPRGWSSRCCRRPRPSRRRRSRWSRAQALLPHACAAYPRMPAAAPRCQAECVARRYRWLRLWRPAFVLSACNAEEKNMVTPVVPNQFEVGKNKIVHKPTQATFSFDTGHTTFKSVDWGRADEQSSSGEDQRKQDYRKDDVMRVARQ